MNPVKTIGRYEIPIASVVMTERRTGWKAIFRPGFDVVLASGVRLYLTNKEKAELDEARGMHAKVMDVHQMIETLKAGNRPGLA